MLFFDINLVPFRYSVAYLQIMSITIMLNGSNLDV